MSLITLLPDLPGCSMEQVSRTEEHQSSHPLASEYFAQSVALSQAEQVRIARHERRQATFTQVHELYAQGWSCASIARILGIHKKTAVKYAATEHFPESRSDRRRKLAPPSPVSANPVGRPPENTLSRPFTRRFVARGTLARKRLCVSM